MRNALNGRIWTRDIEQATSVVCWKKSSILKYAIPIIVVTLLFVGVCPAQTQFARAVGVESRGFGRSILQTTDGGYAVSGYIKSLGLPTHNIFFLLKFNFSGSVDWAKSVREGYSGCGYSVIQTTDGGYVVTGRTKSSTAFNYNLFLVKLDSTGSLKWAKEIGGTADDCGRSIVRTTDGGYVVVGYTRSFGTGGADLLIVKFSSSGSLVWAKAVGGLSTDYGYSVVQTTDGGYALAGYTESFGAGSGDLFLVKLNSIGLVEWAKIVGGTNEDYGYSVVQTTDGGYAVAGYTESFGAGCEDLFIVKFSSTGSLDWAKAVGSGNTDYGESVVQTSDGGYVVAGNTKSFGAGDCDLFLVKLNSSGSLEWAKSAGGGNSDYGYSIVRTTDDGYAVVGYTTSFGVARTAFFLVKFDSNGNTCIGSEAFPTVTDVLPSVDSVSPTVTIPPISISGVTPSVSDVTPTVTEICTNFISEPLSKPISFELTVSPNPFNSSCEIMICQHSRLYRDCATVEIYDLQGRLVWNKPSDSDNVGATSLIKGGKPDEVPINKGDVAKRQGVSASTKGVYIWQPEESISSGVYLVRATTDDGQQITKRIVYLK